MELAGALNRLADRIDELLVAERGAVADLSHRLRTPVTALRLDAEGVPSPSWRRPAPGARRHTAAHRRRHRAGRSPPGRGTDLAPACDATAVVRERLAFWSALAEDQGRPVDVDLRPGAAAGPVGRAT